MRLFSTARYFFSSMNFYASKIPENNFYTKLDMFWCALRYGASPSNFYHFCFSEAAGSQRKTYTTHRISQQLIKKYNRSSDTRFFSNKYLFSQRFREFYGRTCFLSEELTPENFNALTSSTSKLIYKPLEGGQGGGIQVYNLLFDDGSSVYQKIKHSAPGIVEPWIEQHADMSLLYPHAVNPIRVQSITRDGVCYCLAATLTVGHHTDIANASSKAIFALIDIDTGIVYTNGIDYDGNLYPSHPETKVTFPGYQIPFWREVLLLLKKAGTIVPNGGYVGWDIAITPTGPILIEGNHDPGYTAYQLPNLTKSHQGTYPLFKPFLR